jgi:hypothetical protein
MLLILALVVAVTAAGRGLWSPCGLSMLSSLNPVSERTRGHRFALTAGWYVSGAVVGGLLLGGGCAILALVVNALGLPEHLRLVVVAAGAVVGVWSDSRFGWSLPEHPRQVDERWMVRYRRWIYASGYGVQIGTGFATYIMTAAVYLTALLAVLAGPALSLLIGGTFGLARGAAILVTAGATTPERLRSLLRRVDALGGASLGAAIAVQGAAAITAAWVVGGPAAAAIVLLVVLAPLAIRRRVLVRA